MGRGAPDAGYQGHPPVGVTLDAWAVLRITH